MKRHAAAADRNKQPILEVLSRLFPEEARILEIGSGTGQHAAHFTAHRPGWSWQPTDGSPDAVASTEAYRAAEHAPGFLPARVLDVTRDPWPSGPWDAIFSANVIHISPWQTCLSILDGAEGALSRDGVLALYGPFRFSGVFTAESNAAFDARLRSENSDWGVRDIEDVTKAAGARGFAPPSIFEMPANNHILVYRRG